MRQGGRLCRDGNHRSRISVGVSSPRRFGLAVNVGKVILIVDPNGPGPSRLGGGGGGFFHAGRGGVVPRRIYFGRGNGELSRPVADVA